MTRLAIPLVSGLAAASCQIIGGFQPFEGGAAQSASSSGGGGSGGLGASSSSGGGSAVCDGAASCGGCVSTADCAAPEVCQAKMCVAPSCADGMKDGDETDVDCGGTCSKCADGKSCLTGADCAGGVCRSPASKCCTPVSQATACAGKCGASGVVDNCGRAVDCSANACPASQRCGGGGAANVCGALFDDDFTRTTGLGASWKVWYGSYSTDGTYAVSGPPPMQGNWASVVPSIGTNDYEVAARLLIPAGSLYSGIVARGSSSSDFTLDLYAAQISSSGDLNLYRRNNAMWTQLATYAAGIQTDTPYTVTLLASGSAPVHLVVSLDGVVRITYDDAAANRVTAGAPGIENYDANVKYDWLSVLTP
jgi:hypothetical protein